MNIDFFKAQSISPNLPWLKWDTEEVRRLNVHQNIKENKAQTHSDLDHSKNMNPTEQTTHLLLIK